MIVEAGHFALILALAAALLQGTLPMVAAGRGDHGGMALAASAALVQCVLVSLAFGALMHAYVTSDFSVLNVAANSHSAKPLLYRIAGTWGNHEGSMLLWVLILALFGAALALFGRTLPAELKARALAVQAWIGIGFYLFILLTSNPFARLHPPAVDGQGLNPLLQDPGLAFHPPFLYLGYVGFSMAFSFAVAALLGGRVDGAWARWVRPWTLAAWTFLTIGIALGSWWAYYELGWGGWWFWDPVENASLLPWLAGTALLHSAIVVEKRDALKGWTVFLAILTFALSLLGTFLVRSGVLTSVHAFATDPTRGVFILVLLVVVIGGALALFAWRGPALSGGGLFDPVSREGSLLLNNLFLSVMAGAVLLGTLYPLIYEAAQGGKISVGPPYFVAVFVPLAVPLLLAMAIGPLLSWKRAALVPALRTLWFAGLAALAAALVSLVLWGGASLLGLLGMALAAWLLAATFVELAERARLFRTTLGDSARRLAALPRSAWGMTLAHGGLAIAVAGMTASTVWPVEHIQVMERGQVATVGGYAIRFEGARPVTGPNYEAVRGKFTVADEGGSIIAVLEPERRRYPVEGQETTEAAIRSRLAGDLYAVIGAAEEGDTAGGGFVTRIYVNPLVGWIWAGVGFMVAGGLVSLSDRRLRVGAPRRRRADAAVAVASPAGPPTPPAAAGAGLGPS